VIRPPDEKTTRYTVLTPTGRGAIAVVAVAGKGAAWAVDSRFFAASGMSVERLAIGRIAFGHWGAPDGEEVVVCRREESVEIHCHGGRAAVQAVCQSLREAGGEPIDPTCWLRETDPDPIRADARAALAMALTERTAMIFLDQINGALRHQVARAIDLAGAGRVADADALLQTLIRRWRVGRRLLRPAKIVLTGPPNVGKSSLINAMVGYERAIVFDAPGTTRDAVVTNSAMEGWPVELIDTAGLREAESPLEQAGIDLAQQAIATADTVLVVTDATTDTTTHASDWQGASEPIGSKQVIRIVNKIDLLTSDDRLAFSRFEEPERSPILTSAVTGEGLGDLLHQIARTIVPDDPKPGEAIPFRQTQVDLLRDASKRLGEGDPSAMEAVEALLASP